MERMKIVIDGANFCTLDGFFDEMERVLTKDLSWKPGHGLDALNDLLRGGFGVHEYGQPLEIQWIQSEKSRQDLGYRETERHWTQILTRCHPSNRDHVREKVEKARRGEGKTLFDLIVEIILDTDNSGHDCTLFLDGEGRSEMGRCRSIAIDGPAGAGKSTLARQLAAKLGFLYVDTGAIYRTVALKVLREKADPADPAQVIPLLEGLEIRMDYGSDGVQRMFLEGEDVSAEIRKHRVSGATSQVSAIPEVRDFLLDFQRKLAREQNVVMDGRDIGTVVLPGADVKVFLTAAPEARARRRYDELVLRGEEADFEAILRDVKERDYHDEHRATAPLRQAADAILLDTTHLNLEQSLARLQELVEGKLHE